LHRQDLPIALLPLAQRQMQAIAAGDRYFVNQAIEGFNAADLGFGAAGAQAVALSFWVQSSLTGTYCATLINSAGDRSYVAEYSIAVANTWEYKTIYIPGDTSWNVAFRQWHRCQRFDLL
jgi:hypothetical protein